MTTDMVRKQIYIRQQQQIKLRQLAHQRGISEAEIIRRAIDKETSLQNTPLTKDSQSALEELLKAAYTRNDQPAAAGEPYRFKRSELYSERESHWIHEEKKD